MARRLLAPDGAIRQADVRDPSGVIRRYDARQGGIVTVSDRDAKALRQEGFTEASASGAFSRSGGYRCTECGHGSFFTTCGRCGATCERE